MTQENKNLIIKIIEMLNEGGGTNIYYVLAKDLEIL